MEYLILVSILLVSFLNSARSHTSESEGLAQPPPNPNHLLLLSAHGQLDFLTTNSSLESSQEILALGDVAGESPANASDSSSRTFLVHFGNLDFLNFGVAVDEIHLTAPELIMKRGYPFECHTVTTTDGYILSMHRIPSSLSGRPAVLLFHGMFQTSRDFLMNSGSRSLALKLSDEGFDVWLANARGNSYSRGHTTFDVNDPTYWNFSVDEVIRYDAPAMIDYVLGVTGQSSLHWIGYSLGTAVGLGLMSVRPEYNEKFTLLTLIGTTAYVGNAKSPMLRLLAPFEKIQDRLMTTLNHGETLPSFLFPIMRTFLPILCMPEAKLNIPGFCSVFLMIVAGFNFNQANPRQIPIMLGGTPGSLGIKMLSQWYQWINCGKFTYFDFGNERTNVLKYGAASPPSYNLSAVTARVVNFWASNDWLSVPDDVDRTVRELPNVLYNVHVTMETWNHLDFIYGKDADVYVYEELISIMKLFT